MTNVRAGNPERVRRPTLAWLQLAVPRLLARTRPDAAHFPTGRAPLRCPVPYVLTVHDLSVLESPRLYPWREQALVAPWLAASIRRAAAIIAISRDTADAIRRRIGPVLPPIHWIPEAAAPAFSAVVAPDDIRALRARLGLSHRYWLHVGSITTRKNLSRLVAAFGEARESVGSPAPMLVLAGPDGNATRAVQRAVRRLGLDEVVKRPGYVPETDLPVLYAGAELIALPSLHEGCGLPALEAMASGRPLLHSGRGGLAEVLADVGLLGNPESVASLARGLATLGSNPELRARLGGAGRERSQVFRWSDAAARTVAVYESIAPSRRPPNGVGV